MNPTQTKIINAMSTVLNKRGNLRMAEDILKETKKETILIYADAIGRQFEGFLDENKKIKGLLLTAKLISIIDKNF